MLLFTFQDSLVSCLPRVLDQIRELLFKKIFLRVVLQSVFYLAFVHKGCFMTKIMHSSMLSGSLPP